MSNQHGEDEWFWARVNVLGPDDCWEWIAAKFGVCHRTIGAIAIGKSWSWLKEGEV